MKAVEYDGVNSSNKKSSIKVISLMNIVCMLGYKIIISMNNPYIIFISMNNPHIIMISMDNP